jgi:hypothetical protein
MKETKKTKNDDENKNHNITCCCCQTNRLLQKWNFLFKKIKDEG